MKIGIIGLGDIAVKAYLPVMAARDDVEVHLCSRNEEALANAGRRYRFRYLYQSVESLMEAGIGAAFVHTATSAHAEVVQTLLENNINVYVDKPVTYDLASTERLVALARRKGLILMAGFNRRFAPAYAALRSMKNFDMVVMQKNRMALPADVRTFIFDDFIHVIDTLLYLLPHSAGAMTVSGKLDNGKLVHVVMQLRFSDGGIALGIMNRDSGTTEERLEIFSPSEKRIVTGMRDTVILQSREETRFRIDDWESTLYRRGFPQITEYFLRAVTEPISPEPFCDDLLRTHTVCEEVVQKLLS